MNRTSALRRLFDAILEEAENNPRFADRLLGALGTATQERATIQSRPGRRKQGVIDPFAVYLEGEAALREALGGLDVDQLKDIVAEHGMDLSKLAMKWKTTGRLVELIVTTVRGRSQKGDAFRSGSRGQGTSS